MIDPKQVEEQGFAFALRIMETLAGILPSGNLGFNAVSRTVRSEAYVVISQAEDLGLELTISGKPIGRLAVEYRCTLSEGSRFLAVRRSTFKVYVGNPVFALDYDHSARADSPAAHWNVYANRKDVTDFLRRAGAQRRGRANRRSARDRASGVVGVMHFPVGGHRFRPCLEDVLDMVWAEVGIDVRPTAAAAIAEGRRAWRRYQLKAAVSDDPWTAAKELVRLGVVVDLDSFPELSERTDRTSAL